MDKVIIILSGGQDSFTCLFWALVSFDEVEAITFNYGQNHEVEIQCAKDLCESLGIKHTIVDISFLKTIVDSALTSGGDVTKRDSRGVPGSFVPNRNQLFITLAHSYAQKVGARHLVTGVCQTDHSGYPDCRDQYIKAIEDTTNLGSGYHHSLNTQMNKSIKIHTPLMWKTKAETFLFARSLGYLKQVVEMSHTCYLGEREELHDWGYGCGQCPAWEQREQGWNEFVENIKPDEPYKQITKPDHKV